MQGAVLKNMGQEFRSPAGGGEKNYIGNSSCKTLAINTKDNTCQFITSDR